MLEFLIFFFDLITAPPEFVFNYVFGFTPVVLRTMCVSMLVLTVGKILGFYERKTYAILRILIYVWFLIYTFYSLALFSEADQLDYLDWSTILFQVLAPFCLIIVGFMIGKKFKQYLHFDLYYVLMIIYLIFGILWEVFRPTEIVFSVFVFYWCLLIIAVYAFSHIHAIGSSDESEKLTFWKKMKILSYILITSIVFAIVFIYLLGLNDEEMVQNWVIGIFGVFSFSFLSLILFDHPAKKVCVWLTFFFLSWLISDIEDLIRFFFTPVGVYLFVVIILNIIIVLVIFQKKAEWLGMSVLISTTFAFIIYFLSGLNDERLIENWALGLSFALLFAVLYLLPEGRFWYITKRFHLFMVIFWVIWFFIDFSEFILIMINIYG